MGLQLGEIQKQKSPGGLKAVADQREILVGLSETKDDHRKSREDGLVHCNGFDRIDTNWS
jgi:hypothetical protein